MPLFGGRPNVTKLNARRDVKGLIRTLSYRNDSKVRSAAAQALGLLKDVRAVEPLLAALKDPEWMVRRAAARALGQLGDARAVEPLIEVTEARLDSSWVTEVAQQSLDTLTATWPVERWIAALRDSNVGVRVAAAQALSKLGDAQAVEPLIAALKDPEGKVREAAAQALGEFKDSRAVEPLIGALTDEDPGKAVRRAAARALGKLGDTRAVEPLLEALKDGDDDFFRTTSLPAAEALGQIKDPRIVEPLIAALQDPHRNVRRAAGLALGKLGDARAIEPLIAVLKDTDWGVSQEAVQALGELGDARAVEPIIATLQTARQDAEDADKSGNGYSGSFKFERVAKALGKLGDARAVEPLRAALKSESYYVRQAVKEPLRQLGVDPASVPTYSLDEMPTGVGNGDRASIEQLARQLGVKPVGKEALQTFDPANISPEVTGLVVSFRYLVESGAQTQAQAAGYISQSLRQLGASERYIADAIEYAKEGLHHD